MCDSDGPHAGQGLHHRALLAATKGDWPTSELRPAELPRLARPKGCFAAYDVRSVDELSGRTTGRPGYIGPDTAHAMGGTAELALRYSITGTSASTRGSKHYSVMTTVTGRLGLLEYGQRRRTRRDRRTVYGTTGRPEQRTPPPTPPRPQYLLQYLLRDYGPDGAADGLLCPA
jgi:hypothetical protein